jgi:hypothetical protein
LQNTQSNNCKGNMAPLPNNSTDETTNWQGLAVPSSASSRRQAGEVGADSSRNSSEEVHSGDATSNDTNIATPSQTGALNSPDGRGSNQTAATLQIEQLEADALAKQQARVSGSKQGISTPGAYEARSSALTVKPAALPELEGAHLDAAAKQRARSQQANAFMTPLESDVLAMPRGRPSSHTDSTPGAYSARSNTTPTTTNTVMTLPELVSEQGDLLAKQKARHVSSSVDQLDSDVMAKQQRLRATAAAAAAAPVQPGAYESSAPPTGKLAAAKQRGQSGHAGNGSVVPPMALVALSLAEADGLVNDRARREPGMWSQQSTVGTDDVMAKAKAPSRIVSPDAALQSLDDAITNKFLRPIPPVAARPT